MTVTITPIYIDLDGITQINLDKLARFYGMLQREYTFGSSDGDGTPTTDNYFVRLMDVTGRYSDIPMGSVTNQPSWTNDEAGMIQCVEDIDAR